MAPARPSASRRARRHRVATRAAVRVVIGVAVAAFALVAVTPRRGRAATPATPRPLPRLEGLVMRVAVGSAPYAAALADGGSWIARDAWGRVHARGEERGGWQVERRNRRLRLVSSDGRRASPWSDEPFVLEPSDGPTVAWGARRYRGAVALIATDTAIVVVNRVPLEDYLRGVVPIEIGARGPNESAALEAQAVAARSYSVARHLEAAGRPWDLTAAATDQVYGGAGVEHVTSDAAIAATTGFVLIWGGRVVRAPYHSTCGGTTAAPSEIWQGAGDEGYLRAIRDRIPGSERAWCEISPRFQWERRFDRTALEAAVDRYVGNAGSGMLVAGGALRGARVERLTPSGRVESLVLDTDGGPLRLRGNAIRFALRGLGGEILNSTYFSLEPVIGQGGRLTQLTVRGGGSGHGVGMCQWGAIGRARAGHDVRAILSAYYPGTVLTRLP